MRLFTLLLHKGSAELTAYHHKKSGSSILIVSCNRRHLINPTDNIP